MSTFGSDGDRDPVIVDDGFRRASGGLDWRAIAAGAGATIAMGFSATFLMKPLYARIGIELGWGTVIAINGLVAMITHAVGGATAGALARHRGAVHGALAMLLASAFGLAVTMIMLVRQGGMAMATNVVFWIQWLGMALLCLVVGTLAGMAAARIAAAKPSR